MQFLRTKTSREMVTWPSFLCLLQLVASPQAMAEQTLRPDSGMLPATAVTVPVSQKSAMTGALPSNLNLGATTKSVLAGGIAGFHPTAIKTGGLMQLVNANSLLTPAQVLAVNQVLTSGQQNLLISGLGSAVGGSATISAGTNNTLSNMVIPHNVKVTSLLTDNVLNITGNLTNAGALYFSGNGQQLDVNANNINNLAGGVIASLQAGQNLTLHAVQNINNAGSITSGGNLTLNAGGTINNSGNLLANNNVNLNSAIGNYINSGNITASTGNINIASATASTATSVDGLGGTLSALMGSINVGSSLSNNLNMKDGNYLSQALNLKGSNIEVNVGDVTGTVNVSGCEAHFWSETENLSLGVWDVSGDPLISNTGNIDISQTAALSGTEYVILAGGNITSNTDTFTINTSSNAKAGGTVMLGAGVNYKSPSILGPSKTGGDILLSNLKGTIIDSSSSKLNSAGGNVTLFAFANPNDATVGGHVLLGSTTTIKTAGNGTGKNGDVLVVAGAQSTVGTPITVQLGNINTAGGASGTGSIGVYTSTPNTAAKAITIDTTLGTVKSGSFIGGTPVNGAVTTGALTTSGGNVTIAAGGNANAGAAITVTGAIDTSSTTKAAGNVSLTATNTTGSNITVTGNITTTSLIHGGNVTVASPGTLSLQAIDSSDHSVSPTGAAGNVILNAGGTGSKAITFTGISATGTSGGLVEVVASGSITSNAASLGASQYNINSGGETTGSAGNIIVLAGVKSTLNSDGTLSTTTVSSSGGDLLFSGQATAIRSSVGANNIAGNAGNITLAAGGVSNTAGRISIAGSIEAEGGQLPASVGKSGNVFVSAGEITNATNPVTIVLQNMDTTNGTQAGGGDITIKTGQVGSNLAFTASGALQSGDPNSGANITGAVSVGNISTTGANIVATGSTGGNVTITAGRNISAATAISTGSISTGSSTLGPGGVTAASSSGGNVIITSGILGANVNEDIVIGGNITTTGYSSAATGGEVRIIAGTNLNLSASTVTTGTSGSGAGGGSVTLLAGSSSQKGNITFKNVSTTGIFGGAVEMIASGNISSTFTGLEIDSSGSITNQNGNGGNVILVAGASATTGKIGTAPTISINGSSGFGGNITLTSGSSTVIDTTFSGLFSNVTGSGGAVTMLAYGTAAGTGKVTLTGDISTGSYFNGIFNSSTKITTYIGGSGNVIVVAEGPNSSGPTINIQNIDTNGTVNGTGTIILSTASPGATAGQPLVINDLSGNVLSGNATGTSYVSGGVKAGNLATNGGSVTVNAGSNNSTFAIDLASIDTHANSTLGGSGGAVYLTSGLDKATSNTSIRVTGNISTQGFTITDPGVGAKPVTGVGGNVAILTPADINVVDITTGDSTSATSGSGANGGTVILFAGDTTLGTGNVSFGTISTKGGSTNNGINNTGAGGDVEIVSIGTSGAISGTLINTDQNSSVASGDAGSVMISTPGGISVTNISMKAALSLGRAGYAFLSAGAASGTTIVAAVDASTGSGSNQGNLFGFFNNTVASKFDGSIANIGDKTIAISSAPTQLALGMTVSGAGVPAGTFITSLSYTGSVLTSIGINNAATGKGAATFNSASTSNISVSLNSSNLPAFYSTAPGALPGLPTTTLAFSSGAPSSIQETQGPSNIKPVFYSAGGFTSINNPATDLAITGDSRLIVPIVSLSPSGLTWNNSASASSISTVTLAFFGTSVTIGGNSNRFQNAMTAVSPGNISITSTSLQASALNLGTIVTPAKFSATIPQNISLQGTISASQVYLDSVGGATPGTGPGGTIAYNSSTLLPIFTNNLQINSNGAVGDFTNNPGRPLNIQGRGDGVSFHDSAAGSFAIQANGNLYLDNISTTKIIYTGVSPGNNSTGNMVLISTPFSQNQGSITFTNAIDTPYGNIFLAAAGSISTTGVKASLTATERSGTSPIPGGGGSIFLLAGATATMASNSVSVLGRSGIGGDISLPLITDNNSFNTQTDRSRFGGDIAVVAYSNTVAGLIGGTITIPSSSTIGAYSPSGTDTSARGSFGIAIVGEASGGPTADVTISTGNVYGGVGSVNIATATPAGSVVAPVSIGINTGDYSTKFFTGNLPNGSISTQKVSASGAGSAVNNKVSEIGLTQSGISIVAGGFVSTQELVSIGLSGSTPVTTNIAPPYQPAPGSTGLNGYAGGAGGAVYVNGNLGVSVNGGVQSFGGGGGGGTGAPFAGGLLVGGNGGNGGAGGVVAIQSNGYVLVNGGINSSGGGGGGGGGGVGGSGITEHGAGGTGGSGGSAGDITVTGGNQLGTTIQVAGDIFAVAGGRGGNGGTGMTNSKSGIYGGSGGGGGGSYGAGGGGGGAGVLEPTSANFSGLGGAGGGGTYGGGGGDTQNIASTAAIPQQQSGFGGWGGGAYLPILGNKSQASGVYAAGVFGGAPNESLTSPTNGLPYFSTATSGSGNVGGFGGHYYTDSGLLSSGTTTLLPSAIGGTFANGGSGGASANTSYVPAVQGEKDAFGLPGADAVTTTGAGDGIVTMTANTFSTPSNITAGNIFLKTNGVGSTGAGNLTITGNLLASGKYSGSSPNPNCTNCAITAWVGSTLSGNLVVNSSTTINTYSGRIILENDNTSGLISIGSNSQIFAHNGGQYGLSVSIGLPTWFQKSPVPAVQGSNPANVFTVISPTTKPANFIAFGTAGITAQGPQNTIFALGTTPLQVAFQSGGVTGGNKNSITLGGGTQLGASNSTPISSLDLTDSSTIQTITAQQTSGVIGGALTFTKNNNVFAVTGGTMILYPINLSSRLSALNIPNPALPLSVTLTNFQSVNPINVNISDSSTSNNVVINSPLILTGSTQPLAFNVSSNQGSTFGINIDPTTGAALAGKGAITTSGSLTFNVQGSTIINGAITASAGTININNSVKQAPINITSTITASKGFSAITNDGDFILGSGALKTAGTGINVSAAAVQFGTNSLVKAAVTNTAGLFSLTATNGITVNSGSTVASTGGINWSSSSNKVTINGALSSTGGSIVLTNSSSVLTENTSVGANISGSKGVTINSLPNFSQNLGTTISSSNSPITLEVPSSGGQLQLNGKVAAGSSTVTLSPSTFNQAISLGGAAAFNVSPANIAAITAGTLQIGDGNNTGTMTVGSNIDSSKLNLSFVSANQTSASFTSTGQTITMGVKNLTINVGGAVNTGTVSGGTIVSIKGGTVTLNGALNPKSALTISTVGSLTTGNIAVGSNLPAVLPATFTLTAGGSNGGITGLSGLTFGPTVTALTLGAGAGGFGVPATVNTSAKTVSLSFPGTLTLNATASFSLGNSTVTDLVVNNNAKSGVVTTTGNISGTNLTINMTDPGKGSIVIGSAINESGNAALNASGTGTITSVLNKGVVTANKVTLVSGTGAIGATKSPIVVAASNLSANTTNAVYLQNNSVGTLLASKGTIFSLVSKAQDSTAAITLGGDINATTSINLAATDATSGSVHLGAFKLITTTNGIVTLTASGKGDVTQTSGDIKAAKSLTINAGTQGVSLATATNAPLLTINSSGPVAVSDSSAALTLGNSSGGASFVVTQTATAASKMTVGSISARSITLTANSGSANNILLNGVVAGVAGASDITFNVSGSLTGSGTKIIGNGLLTINGGATSTVGTSSAPVGTAVSSYNVSTSLFNATNLGSVGGSITTNAGALTLKTTGVSNIGSSSAPLATTVNGGTITLSTLTNALVNVSNTGAAVTLGVSTAGLSFGFQTTGTLTALGVSTKAPSTSLTGAGNITLVNAAGAMNINGNVQASGGNIILQNKDTASGTINIAASKQVTTIIKGATNTSQGSVTIGIANVLAAKSGQVTSLPGFVITTKNGGGIFAGANAGNIQPATPGKTANLQAIGADVIFDTTTAGRTITIGAGATVKADPIPLDAPTRVGGSLLSPTNAVTVSPANAAPAAAPSTNNSVNNGNAMNGFTSWVNNVATQTAATANKMAEAVKSAVSQYLPSTSATRDEFSFIPENFILFDGTNVRTNSSAELMVDPASDTVEISSEFKPAGLHTLLAPQMPTGMKNGSVRDFGKLGVDGRMNAGKLNLQRGSVLMVPKQDTTVETAFGSIKVNAGAVVLVVAKPEGVSIYNFHDNHSGSVATTIGKQEIKLAPGHHLTVSGQMGTFDQVNPIACIGHRTLTSSLVGSSAVHTSEFSIMSALGGMKTWAAMKQSKDRNDVHIVHTVLKNAAIIMQVRKSSGSYREYRRTNPENIAMN